MIEKLRRKFVFILMCIATSILLAVFTSILISSWDNNRRISETMLREALHAPPEPPGLKPLQNTPPNGTYRGNRIPTLVATLGTDQEIIVLVNQLHFMDDAATQAAVQAAMNSDRQEGTLQDYGLRWLKAEDNRRIALIDISMEQEMFKNLIINSLGIGCLSLTAFYVVGLRLACWAVRPIELAWARQRQFVADASHELKTPLTVILSNAEMLSGMGMMSDEKKARRIEHIRAEALLMKKLVEDLLALAKSDSAEHAAVKERVDFSFLAMSAALTFEPIIFSEQKKLIYDIPENIAILGDVQRLQQLMGILLDNAVKYCPPEGKITIRLKETDKRTALLEVVNEGDPIPKADLALVFERFYRLDKARSAHGSFGLGLAIAQNIASELGGKIWAESDERTGNHFYIEFAVCAQ